MLASIERYSTIILNFILIAAVSRLLTPAEIGVSAIGATIISFTEAVRDSPSSYLVQQPLATQEDTRTAFTIMLSITLVIASVLALSAGWLARLLHGDLEPFFYVMALSLVPGCVERPIMALLRREMAFGTYASISVASATVTLIATIGLALLGFSYMCFALGQLLGSASAAILVLSCRPYFWIFRPTFSQARRVLPFNAYSAAGAVLLTSYDVVTYTILSRLAMLQAVGFYNRTMTVSRLPDKLNAGLISLALPAFSLIHREGGDVAKAFLRAVEYVTVIEWPLRVWLAIFAYPVVHIILGSQWDDIVALVQITSIAYMFATPQILVFPTLVATGGVRDQLTAALVVWPMCLGIMALGAWWGLHSLAWAMFLIVPIQTFSGLYFVRRRLHFSWLELAQAFGKSALATAASAAAPLLIIAVNGFRFDISWATFLVAGMLSLVGWVAGVWLTAHPIWVEIGRVFHTVSRYFPVSQTYPVESRDGKP